jgi:hypothetical protein
MDYGSKSISDWQDDCHTTAVSKGWWPEEVSAQEREVEKALAQIAIEHCNLSMVLEALRRGEKPEGLPYLDSSKITARLGVKKLADLAKMALIHSEVSEAVECVLDGELEQTGGGYTGFKDATGQAFTTKPEGAVVELADVVIRIMDWCGRKKLGLESAIRSKTSYNATRPQRHGGKLA